MKPNQRLSPHPEEAAERGRLGGRGLRKPLRVWTIRHPALKRAAHHSLAEIVEKRTDPLARLGAGEHHLFGR